MKRASNRFRRSRLDRVPRTFLALALIIMVRTAVGEVIHVPQRHATIRAAVDAARDGEEILVELGRRPAATILHGAGPWRMLQALGVVSAGCDRFDQRLNPLPAPWPSECS